MLAAAGQSLQHEGGLDMTSLKKSARSRFFWSLISISALVCAIVMVGKDLVTAQQRQTGASAPAKSSLSPKLGELEDRDQPNTIKISLEIDKPVVRAEQPVTITATVDRDCYLNIIYVGRKGKVTFLWPNGDSGWESRAAGNTQMRIPGPRSDFRLQFDGNWPEERIVAVACEAEGTLLNARDLKRLPGQELKTLSKDPMDFLDSLWDKLTKKEEQAAWGAAELIVQVGEEEDRYEGRRTSMRPKVTLHVFSGVPDPSWYLTREQEIALEKKIGSAKSLPVARSQAVPPDVGYRGFSLEGLQDPDLRGKAYIFSDMLEVEGKSLAVKGDVNLERWLLDTAGDSLNPETKSYVLKLMAESRQSSAGISPGEQEDAVEIEAEDEQDVTYMLRDPQTEPKSLSGKELKAPYRFIMKAPRYEPQRWNNPRVRPRNNCYNYGTNRLTSTYAQPGRYSGRPLAAMGRMTCAKVRRAVMSDRLIPFGYRRRAEGDEQPLPRDLIAKARTVQGHLAAVAVAPGHDYHWFRLDNNGWWSHKPGSSPATDRHKGRKISDPRQWKTYPQFCGFFFVPTYVHVKDEAVGPQEEK